MSNVSTLRRQKTVDASQELELSEVETVLKRLLLDVASYINTSPPDEVKATQANLPKSLQDEELQLRFTGGWVRDKLLGVESHDIDVAINKMTGYQFGLAMKGYLEIPGNLDKYGIGPASGLDDEPPVKKRKLVESLHKIEANPEKSKHLETVTTRILGLDIDLVNLRKETYSEDSRNPQMEFGSAEEDALRRDATVNALFYNLHTSKLEDFTKKGIDDMNTQIIRTPLEPHQTFKDDPLRVLRLIRFASRLGYRIDPDTAASMGDESIKDALRVKISRERVGIELEKMLRGNDPHRALELIDEFNLYPTIFTDPGTPAENAPLTSEWKFSYDCLRRIHDNDSNVASDPVAQVKRLVFRDEEDDTYLSWMLVAMVPWAHQPTVPARIAKRTTVSSLIGMAARRGFKINNKVLRVIQDAENYAMEISMTAAAVNGEASTKFYAPHIIGDLSRESLGLKVRQWGSNWRLFVLFSLLKDVMQDGEQAGKEDHILETYATFLGRLESLDLFNAWQMKPVVDGEKLIDAMGAKRGGIWLKKALDTVIAWQLRDPANNDVEAAIKEVESHRQCLNIPE